MSDQEKKEKEIMNQEMSRDEMETVAGGACPFDHSKSKCENDTAFQYGRPIRKPDGSVNCAATVEDGSYCWSDDACYGVEVNYMGLTDCAKAWQ